MSELKIVKECEWARWYECDGKTAVVVIDGSGECIVRTYDRTLRFTVRDAFEEAERLLRKWWDLPEPVTNEHKGRKVYVGDYTKDLENRRPGDARELFLVDQSLRYPYLIKTTAGAIASYRYCKLAEGEHDD
jgi:hypothetical protein